MSKTFSELAVSGENRGLDCLQMLIDGNPERFAKSKIKESCASLFVKDLEEINKRKVETNPLLRIRDTIKRFNSNVGKLQVELSHVDETKLSEHQKASLKSILKQRENLQIRDFTVQSDHQGLVKTYCYANFPLEIEFRP